MSEEKRAPLLSDEEVEAFIDEWANGGKRADYAIRDFYEAKITKGELMVVKTVKCENEGKDEAWCEWLRCPDCNETTPVGSNFCPGCGAKIIK